MKAVKCATSPPPDSQHATTLATSDPLHTSWSKMIQTNPTRMSHGNDSSVLKQVSQNFAQGPMPGYNRAYLIVPVQLPPPLGVLKDTHLGFRENYLQLKQKPKSCFNFNMSRIKSSMVDSIGCILTILIHSATHLQVVLFLVRCGLSYLGNINIPPFRHFLNSSALRKWPKQLRNQSQTTEVAIRWELQVVSASRLPVTSFGAVQDYPRFVCSMVKSKLFRCMGYAGVRLSHSSSLMGSLQKY